MWKQKYLYVVCRQRHLFFLVIGISKKSRGQLPQAISRASQKDDKRFSAQASERKGWIYSSDVLFAFYCICNLTSHYKLFVTWQQSNYTGYACNFDVSIKIPTLWRTAYGTFHMSRRTKVNRSGGIGGVDPACRTVTIFKYLINEQITWTIQKQRFGCSQYVSHSVSYFESQMCLTVFSYLAWLLGNKTKSGFFSPWSFPLLLCFVEWLGAFMFGRGRLKVI